MPRPLLALACLALAPVRALGAQPSGAETPPKPGFVVVAPAAWAATLAPFVEARGRELAVELAVLEDVVAGGTGVDAPERLKRFLYEAWRERGARYALLVGDADTLPVRFMVLDRKTPAAFDYAFYASDLYYADVAEEDGSFDDWNAEREGFHGRYFGEVRGEANKDSAIDYDGASYTPELGVGRWPVSDRETLAAVVAKTLAFGPSAAAPSALFVHADGWVDVRGRADAMADELAASGFRVERQVYGRESNVPGPASVLAGLRAGATFTAHIGHGTTETWHGCFGAAERDAVASVRPGVFFSVGCSTGHLCTEPPYGPYLDETGILHRGTDAGEVFHAPPPPPASLQPGRLNSTGLGERLVRMPAGGAVAYIGCNTGAQPCAVTLLEGFTEAIARGDRVGDAWRHALARYVEVERLREIVPTESWYPASVFFQGMKFMLFGDPTLALR